MCFSNTVTLKQHYSFC